MSSIPECQHDGVAFIAAGSTTTNADFKTPSDINLKSVTIYVDGGSWGDRMSFSVVDVDGIVGPAGTVLKTYTPNFFVPEGGTGWYRIPCEGSELAGLYLRATYVNAAAGDAKVIAHYGFYKLQG